MKTAGRMLLWLWLLTKRLYKKPTFLAILVLIPLVVLGYSISTQEDSGMLVIALAGETESLDSQLVSQIRGEGQLLRYVECESAGQAELMVRTGKADAAWIFPADLQAAADSFARSPVAENAFVRVVQREENVALMLARERLSGVLYLYIARSYYLQFARENYPELQALSDEQLLEYCEDAGVTGQLFSYDSAAAQNTQKVHYLMSPIRGLLAIVIVLGGVAAAMYWLRDKENGTFQWVPANKQLLPELGGQLVTCINLCAASLLALLASGMAAGFCWELLTLLLYSLCVAAFCMLLRRLLGSIRGLGTVLPLLIVAMLLLCPVFFDLGELRRYQLLLPPTYYINGVYDHNYLIYMVGYTALCCFGCLLFDKFLGKQGSQKAC